MFHREEVTKTMSKTQQLFEDGLRLQKLIELSGAFEDDSFATIKISGDDATRTWHLTIDKKSSFGNTIRQAIDHFPL